MAELWAVDALVRHLIGRARDQRSVQSDLQAIEWLPLLQAGGRVLAQAQSSGVEVPPWDNSAMDGIALAWQAELAGQTLCWPLSQVIAAGVAPTPLQADTAARIFTGAPMPQGADTVIMQEQCQWPEGQVQFRMPVQAGGNVRQRGHDIRAGQEVLAAGQRLGASELGVLAAAGIAQVPVWRRLRVGILSTGDELVGVGQPLGPGQIYDCNRVMLHSLLAGWDCDVVDLGHLPDDRAQTVAFFAGLHTQSVDVVVTSGGVSVGDEDHVKAAVEQTGTLELWKVAIKPGKPFALGEVGRALFVGLPGNPQSVWITALILLRPLLLALQGRTQVLPRVHWWPSGFAQLRTQSRREYLRVRIADTVQGSALHLHPNQSSGALLSAQWAEGLALWEPDQTISLGQPLGFVSFAELI